ncbi:MAG: hypothetical protein GXY39_11240 [Actinomycetales bacterium]|nr:hypothetical protein [Actinomycetales bacterium]
MASETYRWIYLDADGSEVEHEDLVTSAFPTQADAEAWFAESWESLPEIGVSAVTLMRDGAVVYGPMSLEPAD